jgi:large subunit ribosomal protein L31e
MAKKKVIEKKKPVEEEAEPAAKGKKAKAEKGKTPKAEKGKTPKAKKEQGVEVPKEKPAKKAAKKAGKKVAKAEVPEEVEVLEVAPAEVVEEPAEDLLKPEVESEVAETFDEETQLERDFRTAEVGAEAEADIILDRVYVVPLRKAQAAPRPTRAKHAIELLKKFVVRHMKPEGLIIAQSVNERIWEHGIYKPPRRIRIRATKNTEGQVEVTLAE